MDLGEIVFEKPANQVLSDDRIQGAAFRKEKEKIMFIIQTIILGLCLGFVYALMATGLTLPIFGVMRIVNLAHPIFILVGAFAAAYYLFVIFGMDPIFAIPLCAATTAILGAITYKLVW